MSNTFTSTPTLVDPSRVTAGLTIRAQEISRLSDLSNYCFAEGGSHNVVSQMYDDLCFIQDSTSFVTMCQWYVPRISNHHNTLKLTIAGYNTGGASAGTVRANYQIGSSLYSADISITDTGRYSSSFNTGTITITGTETDFAGKLDLQLKAPTGQELVILSVQAHWEALSSPLPTGELAQTTNKYIPYGLNRVAADQALSARWGVQMLRNITTLRKRPRVLFNWSGVDNASSSLAITAAGAPPRGIGRGDLSSFYSEAAIFAGTVEDNDLTFKVYINLKNAGATSIDFNIMGNTFTLSAAGWSEHTLDLIDLEELPRSDQFGLSMYKVGVDDTNYNVVSSPIFAPTVYPYIAGLTIVGV